MHNNIILFCYVICPYLFDVNSRIMAWRFHKNRRVLVDRLNVDFYISRVHVNSIAHLDFEVVLGFLTNKGHTRVHNAGVWIEREHFWKIKGENWTQYFLI